MLDLPFFKSSEYYSFFYDVPYYLFEVFWWLSKSKTWALRAPPQFSAYDVLYFCEICLSADFDTIDF